MAPTVLGGGRVARTAVALVASSGLALTAVAAGAAAADSVPAQGSAGSLHGSGTAVLASGAREVVTTNKPVTVAADADAAQDVLTAPEVERTEDTAAVRRAAEERAAQQAAEERAAQAAEAEAAQQTAEEGAATDGAAQGAAAEETATTPADSSAGETASPAPESSSVAVPASSSVGAAVAATALQYQGVPYVPGGASPSGWDCSGFVQWVYAQHGISLPRTSYAQGGAGTAVSAAQAQPGDIVYYGGHVGIYIGGGMMVDAGNASVGTSYRPVYGTPQYYVRVS